MGIYDGRDGERVLRRLAPPRLGRVEPSRRDGLRRGLQHRGAVQGQPEGRRAGQDDARLPAGRAAAGGVGGRARPRRDPGPQQRRRRRQGRRGASRSSCRATPRTPTSPTRPRPTTRRPPAARRPGTPATSTSTPRTRRSATPRCARSSTTPSVRGGAGLDFIGLTDYVGNAQWGEIGRYQRDYPGKLVMRSAEEITYRGHTNNHASATTVDYRTGPVYELNAQGGLDLKRPRDPAERDLRRRPRRAAASRRSTTRRSSRPTSPAPPRSAAAARGTTPTSRRSGTGSTRSRWRPVPYNPFTLTAIREFDVHRRAGPRHHARSASATRTTPGARRAARRSRRSAPRRPSSSPTSSPSRASTRAVKAGRAFVKVLGAKSPDLRLTARTPGGATAMMGDALQEQRAQFLARVIGGGPSSNGGAFRELIVLRDGLPQESVLRDERRLRPPLLRRRPRRHPPPALQGRDGRGADEPDHARRHA